MYQVYKKRTKTVMASISVRVDDYLPPSDISRPEDPHVVLIHEEEKTLNSPKDVQPSNDEENDPSSTDVRIIP